MEAMGVNMLIDELRAEDKEMLRFFPTKTAWRKNE